MNKYEWSDDSKAKNRKSIIFIWLSFFFGVVVWLIGFPVYQNTFVFWIGIVLIGLPLVIFSEAIGNFGLSNRYVSRWPKILRIFFGVFWVLLCWLVFILLISFLSTIVVPPVA